MFGLTQKDSSATNATITGTLNVSNAAMELANIGNLAAANIIVDGPLVAASILVQGQSVYPSVGSFLVTLLPPANQNTGRRMAVSDSTVAAAGANFGSIVVGGGTNFVPVYSNGDVWRIG